MDQIWDSCGVADQTVLSRSRIAVYFGYKYTCGQLQDVQSSIAITDPSCPRYMNTVRTQCGCQVMISAPAPSASIETFAPSTSSYPTITKMPTYSDTHYVCAVHKINLDRY
jgi:hypothetical protein